jgi:hypothetical protein
MVFLITVTVFYAKSVIFQNATLLGTGLVYPGLVKKGKKKNGKNKQNCEKNR